MDEYRWFKIVLILCRFGNIDSSNDPMEQNEMVMHKHFNNALGHKSIVVCLSIINIEILHLTKGHYCTGPGWDVTQYWAQENGFNIQILAFVSFPTALFTRQGYLSLGAITRTRRIIDFFSNSQTIIEVSIRHYRTVVQSWYLGWQRLQHNSIIVIVIANTTTITTTAIVATTGFFGEYKGKNI